MKRLALLLSLFLVCCAHANQVHLAWEAADPATECTDCATQEPIPCNVPVDGYRIFWGADQENLTSYFDAGDSLDITLELPQNVFVGAKSYRSDLDCDGNPLPEKLSGYSNIIYYAGLGDFLPATNLTATQNCETQQMGQTFSSDFSSSTGWTLANATVGSGVLSVNAGGKAVWATATDGLTQYCKIKRTSTASFGGGPAFRITPGSGNYYCFEAWGSAAYITVIRYSDGAWIDDLASWTDAWIAANDELAITVEGTGSSCTVRAWINPTNDVPYDVSNWDSASDPADHTFANIGSSYDLQGFYVGASIQGDGGSNTFDDFTGGDVPSGEPSAFQAAWAKGANVILQAGR